MTTLLDIAVSASTHILIVSACLLAFSFLRIQPINDRFFFSKWYLIGKRQEPASRNCAEKCVNLDFKSYLSIFKWIPEALKMSENDLINHAGLDSAVFLRIYIFGLKTLLPMMILAVFVLVPVNITGGTLFFLRNELTLSSIDYLSISNVPPKSYKFYVHVAMQYLFTFWTCFMLYKEYDTVTTMRLQFMASQQRPVDQYTVLIRNVPQVSDRSISESIELFFKKNHRDTYLCHQVVYRTNKLAELVTQRDKIQNLLDYSQRKFERKRKQEKIKTGFLGLWGESVDSIEYCTKQLAQLQKRIVEERQKVIQDPNSVMPAAFVSFNSRRGAAVCAQMKQSRNPTVWLTSWAPEPRDIYWRNLAIPFVSLTIRKFAIGAGVSGLLLLYMLPIAFAQSLENLETLEKSAPFLRPAIEHHIVVSFLQGFLPGLSLKISMLLLPTLLIYMSKFEGHVAHSKLELNAASKYYCFMVVNVFLGSIAIGTTARQFHAFIHQSPSKISTDIGLSIPMEANFFITYTMVGWTSIIYELLQLKPLVIFHFKNLFIVKTERDKDRCMDPGYVNFPETLPNVMFYFLLAFVYAAMTPLLLPFIFVFFLVAFLVYRHQVINVYNQRYESAAAFWPYVHNHIIIGLLTSQVFLMGVLSTRKAANSALLLIVLPILTLAFHYYCKRRFEPAFNECPLEYATERDEQENNEEGADQNLESYLANAYLHPSFHSSEKVELKEVKVDAVQVDNQDAHISGPPSLIEESPVESPSRPPEYNNLNYMIANLIIIIIILRFHIIKVNPQMINQDHFDHHHWSHEAGEGERPQSCGPVISNTGLYC